MTTIIFVNFVYSVACGNDECFSEKLAKCDRATFTKIGDDANWFYKIIGRNEAGSCEIYVELDRIKQGESDIAYLEGESMVCTLPYGLIDSPQANLERCHGILKEEIQSTLIKKMHSYLLENIGQINTEFQQVF